MQIRVKGLVHIFDKKTPNEFKALDGVSAKFKQGEFVTIIGPTGSGKTTFIEHLNALLRPTSGSVSLEANTVAEKDRRLTKCESVSTGKRKVEKGTPIAQNILIVNSKRKIKNIKKIRSKVGVVFQFAEYQLFEETILKDIIFGPISMGVPKEEAIKRAHKYIKLVGLDDSFLEVSPFSLSGGQKRRVALAGILAIEPEMLVLDEPTAGLDPQGEIEMYNIFKELHKHGKTIVIVTHNLNHVLEHSDRTILFNKGEVGYDGPSLSLMYNESVLTKNNLELPKLPKLVNELEKKGLKIGRVKSIEELATKLGKKPTKKKTVKKAVKKPAKKKVIKKK